MTDRYERLRDALALGLTPGPWRVLDADTEPQVRAQLPENDGHRWDDPTICNLYDDVTPDDSVTVGPWLEALPNAQANAAFIAACDPDTIRALLEERDALLADNEQLLAFHERLRAFLEDIRSSARLTLAIWYDADELAESLGDVYRMADAALQRGAEHGNQ